MSSTQHPTSRREDRDGVPYAVIERSYRAPIEAVWAAVTEPERLERWVGTYRGDPASGEIEFAMTAEGEVPFNRWTVEDCDPPRRFAIRSLDPMPWGADQQPGDGITWRLVLELTQAGGVTKLSLLQDLATGPAADIAASVGPGWAYYLDRLAAALDGGDPAVIAWDGYESTYADSFRRLFA